MKSITGKIVTLGAVLIAVLVALSFVSGIVGERESRMHEAQRSVADGLSGAQTLSGPVLRRVCEETWTSQPGDDKSRKPQSNKRSFELRILPKTLDVTAQATTAQRTRGIYQVNTYALSSTSTALWTDLGGLEAKGEHEGSRVQCEPVQVIAAVGDARGIRSAAFAVNDQPLDVLPGTGLKSFGQGFHALVPLAESQFSKPLKVQLQLELVGTGGLSFTPLGDKTQIALNSNWRHPSFGGRFLPSSREIDANGFQAKWQLSAIATSARQEFLADANLCGDGEGVQASGVQGGGCVESMGVVFMDPVGIYTLNDRATKYGILFIVLTFVGVGLVEVMNKLRVHPVQYLLVGSALCVFFLLLISLSEQMSFGRSYALASAACSVLLGFYGSFVLKGAKAGVGFGLAIAALYGTLYVLLRQEQSALLLGSVLLFAVLSLIMFITRRIDWYER